MLVIQIANYLDQLGPWGKFVNSSTKIIALKLPVIRLSTVESVMASRTSNQARSIGLDVSTFCRE